MPLLNNFVLDTANAPGTSATINLAGAPAGRRSFAAFSSGSVVYYFMDDGTQAEWGRGTFTAGSPNTLTRTVLGNTSGTTSRLNFAGAVRVYNELPAEAIGEFLSSVVASGSAVSLTNNTNADVTSLALTDGVWDVSGTVDYTFSVSATSIAWWINATPATLPAAPNGATNVLTAAISGTTGMATGMLRVTGPATVYLSCVASFTSGTAVAFGFLGARRVI